MSAVPRIDVLIVGAGLSGVGAAYHLQERCPQLRYAIVEARSAIGGTWDLFRYPGVRSDSDIYTLGYSFRPWKGEKSITEGETIRRYVADTAAAFGIDRHIHFGRKVTKASWDTPTATWTVELRSSSGTSETWRCGFLYLCSGYYSYDTGYTPQWPGLAQFRGRLVHPQHWPEDLDYSGKRVVVIGSGATAVTLVPAMAERAAHVVMLQRSPTYIVSRPAIDAMARALHRWLPDRLAHALVRAKNIGLQTYFYRRARRFPERAKAWMLTHAAQELPKDFDVARHLTPRYAPWDQRLCLIPDSDLFRVLSDGRASIVTDEIESFTPEGLRLKSGTTLAADIVVTATGLKLQTLAGAEIWVDGKRVRPQDEVCYRGMMYSGIPNLASTFGYTNASWTLKAELIAAYVCRLLNHMRRHRFDYCVPVPNGELGELSCSINLTSGYIARAADELPRQGERSPWRMNQNYFRDIRELRLSSLDDGVMQFHRAPEAVGAAAVA